MSLFKEYLDSKGKIKKAVVDASGGDPDPKTPPTNPPKEHGGSPYISKGSKKSDKAFGDQGDKDLVYEPDIKKGERAPAKIPTAEQAQIVSLVADAAKRDSTVIEQLVYQLESEGLMGCLIAEMLQYKTMFRHIAEVMGHKEYGPPVCNKLARAMMTEEIAPPLHASLDQDHEVEEDPSEIEDQSPQDGMDDDDIELEGMEEEMPMDDDLELGDDMGQGAPQGMNQQAGGMSPELSSAMQNFKKAMGKY